MATSSVWQCPPRVEADIAIVGGGVTGCATAWALARLAPDLRIVIVEAERLAWGASGRNAGFLLLGTSTDYASAVDAYGRDRARRIWAFTAEAYRLAAEVGMRHDVGFRPSGSALAAADAAEADRLRRSHTLLAEDGVPTDLLVADAANERLGSAGFHAALVVPEGGEVDPARLVRALAGESGAEVREGWRVAALEGEGGRVRVAIEGGGEVVAGRVLVATNAWVPQLVPALAEVVRPVRAQMLATAPAPPRLDIPVYSHGGYFYLRQRPDGRVLVGGARHLHREAEVGYEDVVTVALQRDLSDYLIHHLPYVASLGVERRWAGTMGFSPDGLPALGAVPGVSGAAWAAGFTGHGMGYALRFGALAARTLVGEPDPAADLFDARRLGVGSAGSSAAPPVTGSGGGAVRAGL